MKMQEFGSKRDRIAETLYSSARCCDSVRLAESHEIIINDDEDDKIIIDDHHDKAQVQVHYKEEEEENSDSTGEADGNRCSSYSYEARVTKEIEEESQEDLIGDVFRIKDILAANPGDEELYECLRRLELMQLTVKNLEDTGIGRQVNRLRKHNSKEIKSMVKRLISGWKDLVEEWVKSTTAAGNTSLDSLSATNLNDIRNGLPSAPLDEWAFANQMTSTKISQKSKTDLNDASLKVKLEATRKRLQDGYRQAENAKKQRRVQAIELQDLPKESLNKRKMPRSNLQFKKLNCKTRLGKH